MFLNIDQNENIIAVEEFAQETKSLMSQIVDDPYSFIVFPIIELAIILLLTFLALRYSGLIIERVFNVSKMESRKANTLQKLMKSIARYAIYFVATLTLLMQFGFDPLPVIAGAGVFGLAIGFGAQNLVRDIISGFFMIFERQLEVGDFVEINGQISGTVEEVGLRITKIREYNQRLHYIANGKISQVTNYNREQMRPIVAITVPFEQDMDLVGEALEEICQSVAKKYAPFLIQNPEVLGITNVNQDGVQFTITAVSQPEEFWSIERAIRLEAISVLQKRDIDIAYPRRVLFNHSLTSSP
ncbi:mechanosensitive ion channel family protein [Hazenella sp. IB182357]|uniref:Mechanosensitive ion channel family protein n=1 Tax=Polycladospora coralii TaxID=2771432 RepID=A0A926RV39_9BACL|nr:mechanosensitive ion channel family protein [Polycladospora coralii]MBD1373367.1 mechanosensitive ion channel family protein [Polycladospora coralii]MBS7531634.1 mechanosensitive ion channel family protein [Polycladospora coralii]